MINNDTRAKSEPRGMSFGTDSYHYVVMEDGEVIKNEDAFKPRMTNAEAGRFADLQNACSREWGRKHGYPKS